MRIRRWYTIPKPTSRAHKADQASQSTDPRESGRCEPVPVFGRPGRKTVAVTEGIAPTGAVKVVGEAIGVDVGVRRGGMVEVGDTATVVGTGAVGVGRGAEATVGVGGGEAAPVPIPLITIT